MSRILQNTIKDYIVIAFMDLVSEMDVSDISVADICHRAGCHRTSFYRYFESVGDLEGQFLHRYFGIYTSDWPSFPTTSAKVSEIYQRIVTAMGDQRVFFTAAMAESRISGYYLRWQAIIEGWFRSHFEARGLVQDPSLWELNIEFALSVALRYFEIAFRGEASLELPALTRWMLEYQWGGYVRLVDHEAEDLPATFVQLDQALKERSHLVTAEAKKLRPTTRFPLLVVAFVILGAHFLPLASGLGLVSR